MPEKDGDLTVIIGAGLSGLTVAHHLPQGSQYIILEKSGVAGGLATQFQSGDYWFDYGGHYFHFQDQTGVKDYLKQFSRFREYQRQSKTFLLNRYIPFPVQFHLSHLPGMLRARIFQEMLVHLSTAQTGSADPFANLRDFLRHHFGVTLTELFFQPFLTKYYDTAIETLAANMDKGSIPVPDLQRVQAGYAGKTFTAAGYNPVIYYPARSLRHFIENYARPLLSSIHFNEEVIALDPGRKRVTTTAGSYNYHRLITTMPLNHLLTILPANNDFPAPGLLRHTATLLSNVVLKQKRKRFHWVYLAEEKFPFYRAGLYAGQSNPVCYLERNVPPNSAATINKERLLEDIVFTLKQLQVIVHQDEILYFDARIIPVSYVIFDCHWQGLVPPLLAKLAALDIHSIGRYGTWNYSSMANDIYNAIQFTTKL